MIKKNLKLSLLALAAFSLTTTIVMQTTTETQAKDGESGNTIKEDARYEVRKPTSSLSAEITSIEAYSPSLAGREWITFDHIGYKDSAFKGERHVAYFEEEGGVQFYGYDAEPLNDLMLHPHPEGEDQVLTLLQAPIRADWHTLDGNGILFGVEGTGLPKAQVNDEPDGITDKGSFSGDIDLTKGSNVTISGYAAVATMDEIQIRRYYGANVNNLGTDFEVLFSEPKECPSVNFRVVIEGVKAKVYLDSRLLKEIDVTTTGRHSGILVCYASHGCSSLSSVYTYSHMVNDVEYLAPKAD